MNIVQETPNELEIRPDPRIMKRNRVVVWVFGTVAPIIGIVIIFTYRDILGILLGCLFLTCIVTLVVGGNPEICTFDKMRNKIIFRKWTPLRITITEYWFQEITDIVEWHERKKARYCIIFSFKSGKREIIDGSESEEAVKGIVERIKAFLLKK